jgi:hypothetical protein
MKLEKVKVKLSLGLNYAPRPDGVLGEGMYSSTNSLTSALDGVEWSASRPGRFTPRERATGTHWIGGCHETGTELYSKTAHSTKTGTWHKTHRASRSTSVD